MSSRNTSKTIRNKDCGAIQRFYRSDKWKIARAMKIASAGGRCEMCGGIGTEVHHKVHLTPENVADPEVSISQDNLMLLCSECHNKVHGRFDSKGPGNTGSTRMGTW